MNLFLDCEFDGWKGRLISMALVSEDGDREFYEVVDGPAPTDAWVGKNVMPILHQDGVSYEVFQARLKRFLSQFPAVRVHADYPDDIQYLMSSLITGPGEWMEIQPLTCVVDDDLSAKASKVLHNALEDARAIRDSWLRKEGVIEA